MDAEGKTDKVWLLNVQRKLYQWSRGNPEGQYRELWNWCTDIRNLRCAWRTVATNKGKRTPGIDGVKVTHIRKLGEDAYLEDLREELRSDSYAPSPSRRVVIPTSGKPGEFRPLGIPTVKDRIVQCAVKQIIEPLFLLYNGSNGDGCDYPTTLWSLESRMHSERCMSGSERGYGKPMSERSYGARNLLLPYIPMAKGFCYLVAIMDLASRKVLSWKVSITLDAAFCVEALTEALTIGTPEIFNTDQGSQFTSREFTDVLKDHTIAISDYAIAAC